MRSPFFSVLLGLSLASLALACGGAVVDPSDGDGRSAGVQQGTPDGKGGSGPSTPGAPAATPGAPAPAPETTGPGSLVSACTAVEQGPLILSSESAFAAAIVGVWSLCSGRSFLGTVDEGLEIAADGRWWRLHRQGGALVRGQGPDEEGTWEVIDTTVMNGPGVYQLNLNHGDWSAMVHPALASGPRKMRLGWGESAGDYAIDGAPVEPPPVEPAPGVGPGGFPAAACAEDEGGPLAFSSVSTLSAALVGSWSQCGVGSVFGTSEEGIEINASGRWYKLYTVDGVVVRGQGFDEQGSWEVLDGTLQLNLRIDGGGTVMVHPALSGGPRTMRLDNMGLLEGHYAIDSAVSPPTD